MSEESKGAVSVVKSVYTKSEGTEDGQSLVESQGQERWPRHTKSKRKFAENPREFQYLCHLSISFARKGRLDREYSATGFCIGPRHVITNAHNVFEGSNRCTRITVRFGCGSGREIGTAICDEIYTHKKFVPMKKERRKSDYHDYDVAIIVIPAGQGEPGKQCGWPALTYVRSGEELQDQELRVPAYSKGEQKITIDKDAFCEPK